MRNLMCRSPMFFASERERSAEPSAGAPLEAGMSCVNKNGIIMAAAANAKAAAARDERENDLHRAKL